MIMQIKIHSQNWLPLITFLLVTTHSYNLAASECLHMYVKSVKNQLTHF